MVKKWLVSLLLFCGCCLHSQELFITTGKNFTTYNYKNSLGISNPNLRGGEGSFYQLGMDFNLSKSVDSDKLKYGISLVYNQFNAVGSTSVDSYSWKTNYIGLQNKLSFILFQDYDSFKVKTRLGFATSTIINGEQYINTMRYDITKQEEFSGIVVQPNVGIDFQYSINRGIEISAGYEFSKVFNTSNSSAEELSFTNNQIHFGLHFPLN